MLYNRFHAPELLDNQQLATDILNLSDKDFEKQTHLFHGRYENLYIDENKIPSLVTLLTRAKQLAANILEISTESLQYGFWINIMQPGHITTLHTHDDDDECLSGVYYVTVPGNSGELVLYDKNKKATRISPNAGDFIFFAPDVPHEVLMHEGNDARISIAFNFGLKES